MGLDDIIVVYVGDRMISTRVT